MSEVDLARLRWRCRRGLLELDVLLERFLDRHFPSLTPAERTAFERLLSFSDQELLGYVEGQAEPGESELKEIVRKIRQ